ncbi:hypothetical protein PV325_006134, partial [Microctonus aethiopoides]
MKVKNSISLHSELFKKFDALVAFTVGGGGGGGAVINRPWPRQRKAKLDNCNENDNEVEVEMVVPPDGGWGWVIVAASFMCNLVVDGIIFSFGVMLNHIVDAFNVTKSSVALVGSLQSGFYLMA